MPKNKPREEKKPIGERISALLARTIRFVTYDIWRITENEVSGLKEIYINIIKTVILAVRGFQSENLQTKASALTYSTLLSIVPLLAVLLGIAKGNGLNIILKHISGLHVKQMKRINLNGELKLEEYNIKLKEV